MGYISTACSCQARHQSVSKSCLSNTARSEEHHTAATAHNGRRFQIPVVVQNSKIAYVEKLKGQLRIHLTQPYAVQRLQGTGTSAEARREGCAATISKAVVIKPTEIRETKSLRKQTEPQQPPRVFTATFKSSTNLRVTREVRN
jgi:hypothetical protein